MKALRIIIVAFILIKHEVILHEVILLSAPETRTWQALVIGRFILLFVLVFILLKIRKNRRMMFNSMDVIP